VKVGSGIERSRLVVVRGCMQDRKIRQNLAAVRAGMSFYRPLP
jgi:hypothetical protein